MSKLKPRRLLVPGAHMSMLGAGGLLQLSLELAVQRSCLAFARQLPQVSWF